MYFNFDVWIDYIDVKKNLHHIKIGDMTICQRTFNAKHYPPKIRYTVDLRPQLKSVLNDLTDIFSGKNFNYYYPNFNQNQ